MLFTCTIENYCKLMWHALRDIYVLTEIDCTRLQADTVNYLAFETRTKNNKADFFIHLFFFQHDYYLANVSFLTRLSNENRWPREFPALPLARVEKCGKYIGEWRGSVGYLVPRGCNFTPIKPVDNHSFP